MNDPFGRRCELPQTLIAESQDEFARERRVNWIGEAAQQLIDSGTEAGLFTGGALLAWLTSGGALERRYFRTMKAKSHRTAAAIWRQLKSHRNEDASR